jgi:hypothetical protein
MTLNEAEDCQPQLDELAQFVGSNGHTLERYLKKEGTGFRDLAIQVRSERARKMLPA